MHRHGASARAALIEELGVTPATITRLTNELLDLGILEEIPDPAKKGKKGFPSKLLKIKPHSILTVGIYFDPDVLRTCLADLEGNILAEQRFPIENRAFNVIMEKASRSVDVLIEQSGCNPDRIIGGGITYPGQYIDTKQGTAKIRQFSDWPTAELKGSFSDYFDFPMYHINDAKAACLAELYYGSCKSYQNYCYVWLSYGIGGAAVINQSLYTGHSHVAAEFGGLFPKSQPRPSGQDLLDTLKDNGVHVERLDEIEDTHLTLPCVQDWLSRSHVQLEWLCLVIARTFAPQAIVVGGTLAPQLLKDIYRNLAAKREFGEDFVIDPPDIIQAATDDNPHLGAAVLPIDALINPARYSGRVFKNS
ncbi:ROK family protein [Thaumasiovibrio subtropicus]|uniref:ROK family protein n=1 Tax=Thaumasiovibrio subtropicus TaxID=1891207 RepID=UPI001FE62D8A|nr:ROK family transcriptional regulator [Thaumasiovibrio subtropicus]